MVVVGIIFYEKVEQTIECIASVVDSGFPIVILNNNSSKISLKKLIEYLEQKSNVTVLNSKINLGPAKGRNLIINSTKEPWIFFLDNDIIVKTEKLKEIIVSHIERHTNEEVFIPKLFNVHENQWQKYHQFNLNDNTLSGIISDSVYTNCFPGGASIVNRKTFQRLGLYDEDLFVLEDFEFSIRGLFNLPIKCKLIDDIILFHEHKIVNNSKDRNAVKVRYAHDRYSFAESKITSKYNIKFYSGWEPWVSKQLELMVFNSAKSRFIKLFDRFLYNVSNKIKSTLYRLFNH